MAGRAAPGTEARKGRRRVCLPSGQQERPPDLPPQARASHRESLWVEFRLHDLRRTFISIATHHLERSLSHYTIKRLLNHSSGGDVTAGCIQHPVETLREPMEMVEKFVLRAAGILESAQVLEMRKAA